MEYLQNLSDGSAIPILTAFLLGLLTALSPCPLATNIAAVGYISKDLETVAASSSTACFTRSGVSPPTPCWGRC